MSKIAVIFDFDGTLAPDSTSSFLTSLGLDAEWFWREQVQPLLDEGWDEMPAYLWRMVEWSQKQPPGDRITRDKLAAWGRQIQFFPGVKELFPRIRQEAAACDTEIRVEFYLISSGIGEILRCTTIADQFRDIWSCDFHYNEAGEIIFPRNVVSFTEKTRFIVQISKGLVGEAARGHNKEVNRKVDEARFAIPFSRMIVVGDGQTDIPMFAMVGRKNKRGERGIAIGVSDPREPEKWGRALQLARDQRVITVHRADYSEEGELLATLLSEVRNLCSNSASANT